MAYILHDISTINFIVTILHKYINKMHAIQVQIYCLKYFMDILMACMGHCLPVLCRNACLVLYQPHFNLMEFCL